MQFWDVKALSSKELAVVLQEAEPPTLIDCRETPEWQHCRIDGARHIPMSEMRTRYRELKPDGRYVVYCHHGVRSHSVASFLLRQGFAQIAHLEGGIDAWSLDIDPSVPRY